MTKEQIRQRLLFIIDDASRLLVHLERGRDMDEFTGYADQGWTHISNIEASIDFDNKEPEMWRKIVSMDTEAMELLHREFKMQERMVQRMVETTSLDTLVKITCNKHK
jgi:hypothetical protein